MKSKDEILRECAEMRVPLGSLINVGDGFVLVKALDPMLGTVTDVDRVSAIREGQPHGNVRDFQSELKK
jgi:hypothetical protein